MSISFAAKALAGILSPGTLSAFLLAPPDAREQTVFLGRLADRVEHARQIAPAARIVLSDTLARFRRQQPKAGGVAADMEPRRQFAIARIERGPQRSGP